jgi:hypothetical protein
MESKLKCAYCLHESEPEDRVTYYHVGGKGDIASCVDTPNCITRQLEARKAIKAKMAEMIRR